MSLAIVISTNVVYLGVMIWLLYEGSRVGIFGGGYRLMGGRESFGWGARVAGFILASPLPSAILTWTVILASGSVTFEAIERGDHNPAALALSAVVIGVCVLVSYLFAEITATPYWLYLKKKEAPTEKDERDEEKLTAKDKRRRQRKLERKRDEARLREEEKRRQLEEEERRILERQEAKKAARRPPPLPGQSEDRS